MKKIIFVNSLFLLTVILFSCKTGEKNEFWGDGTPQFEVQEILSDERFPNVVVATDGTVIATWGGIARENQGSYKVRRSEDGGKTWDPEIIVADPGFHGGGVTVDENSGAIFIFVDDGHPPREPQKTMGALKIYRSDDYGRSWRQVDVNIHPDKNGNIPSMHMCEHGITLQYGPKTGRLLRPARVYERSLIPDLPNNNGYNTAIYSDDGGKTWHSSAPFPLLGTGEGAVAELLNGHIYYSSRKNFFNPVELPLHAERFFAWSYDGGETWENMESHSDIPDGPRYRGEDPRGDNFNGHFGLMAGLVRLPVEGKDILLYSSSDTDGHNRTRGTVWASFDGGKTWPVKRLVEEGGFAYSSLAAGREGTPSEGWIYLMYEGGGNPYGYAYMARFNLVWLTGGRDWREFINN